MNPIPKTKAMKDVIDFEIKIHKEAGIHLDLRSLDLLAMHTWEGCLVQEFDLTPEDLEFAHLMIASCDHCAADTYVYNQQANDRRFKGKCRSCAYKLKRTAPK